MDPDPGERQSDWPFAPSRNLCVPRVQARSKTYGNSTARRCSFGRPSQPAQGFTLVELMAVVVIISVVATLAVPAVTRQMRDRRVRAVAEQIADQYRTARMRAMGRGGAVMVRLVPGTTSADGILEIREAVTGGNATDPGAYMPVTSCHLTKWNLADLTVSPGFSATRRIYAYELSKSGGAGSIQVDANTAGGSSVSSLAVCFTPMGRSFLSTDGALTWSPLTNVPFIHVYRDAGEGVTAGLRRVVALLPNGTARLGVADWVKE